MDMHNVNTQKGQHKTKMCMAFQGSRLIQLQLNEAFEMARGWRERSLVLERGAQSTITSCHQSHRQLFCRKSEQSVPDGWLIWGLSMKVDKIWPGVTPVPEKT